MTTTEPTWIATRPAARAIGRRAPVEARRELLEMCGLVPEGLPVIRYSDVLPDDTRNYDVDSTSPDGATTGWRQVAPEPRADRRFVPDGLAS